MKVGAYITVKGMVQGVGYRYFAYRRAIMFRIKGWVSNRPNGDVELEVEAEEVHLNAFVEELRIGPRSAHVRDVLVARKPFLDRFSAFNIDH